MSDVTREGKMPDRKFPEKDEVDERLEILYEDEDPQPVRKWRINFTLPDGGKIALINFYDAAQGMAQIRGMLREASRVAAPPLSGEGVEPSPELLNILNDAPTHLERMDCAAADKYMRYAAGEEGDATSKNIFAYGARTGGYPCFVCGTTHDTNSGCPTPVADQGQKDAPGPAEDYEELNARITREIDSCGLPYEQVIDVLENQAAFMRKARMDEHGESPEEQTLIRLLSEHWPTIECNHETKMDRANCSCSKVDLDWQANIGEAVKSWAEHVLTLRVGGSPARSVEGRLTQEQWNLFHRLWTKAVGGDGYVKSEWLELEGILVRLERPALPGSLPTQPTEDAIKARHMFQEDAWIEKKAKEEDGADVSVIHTHSEEKYKQHLAHVQSFLKEMWATMGDPLEDFGGNIEQLCAELIRLAREQREQLASGSLPSPAPPKPEVVQQFIEAVEALLNWMNGNDLSADHAEQCPEEFKRLCEMLEKVKLSGPSLPSLTSSHPQVCAALWGAEGDWHRCTLPIRHKGQHVCGDYIGNGRCNATAEGEVTESGPSLPSEETRATEGGAASLDQLYDAVSCLHRLAIYIEQQAEKKNTEGIS